MYHPGDYKVVCDRCGITYLRSECQYDWEGLLVCSRGCWEPRHPQEFVRAVPDITRVDDARIDVSFDPSETTLSAAALSFASVVYLTSVYTLGAYDGIGITLDNGIVHWTFLTSEPGARTISTGEERTTSQGDVRTVSAPLPCELNEPLPSAAASGNTVYLPSISGATFLSVNEVSYL